VYVLRPRPLLLLRRREVEIPIHFVRYILCVYVYVCVYVLRPRPLLLLRRREVEIPIHFVRYILCVYVYVCVCAQASPSAAA